MCRTLTVLLAVLFLGGAPVLAQHQLHLPPGGAFGPAHVTPHQSAAPAPATQQSTSWYRTWQYSWTNPAPAPTTVYVPYPVYGGYNSPYPYNYYSPSLNTPSYPVNSYPGAVATNYPNQGYPNQGYPNQGNTSSRQYNPQQGFRAPPLAKSRTAHTSSTESKAKVDKLIEQGDASFGKQQYPAAIAHYKEAARIAPDMADLHLRQGFALLAQKRYPQAVKAIRAGLDLRSDWTASSWRLDKIYADDQLEKTNRQIIKFADGRSQDAELAIAVGVQLYFTDRERDHATTYFVRAQQLGANADHVLDPFLPQPSLAEVSTKPLEKSN